MAGGTPAHTIEVRRKRVVYALLALIVACAAVYSVATAVGPSYFGDDIAYANYAHAVVQGMFHQNTGDVLSIRILQIYPIAFFYLIFSATQVSSSGWDILSFIATLVIVFYIGRELYNEYAGLVAAALLAFMPTVLQISGTMSDNPPMMFMVSLAMLALLLGQNRGSRRWYFVCGAALVAAFLIIPEGLFAIGVVALYLIARFFFKRPRIDRHVQYILYGFLVAVAVLLLFNYLNADNPLITFSFTFNYFQTNSYNFAPQNGNLAFYPNTMFPYHVLGTLYNDTLKLSLNPVAVWSQIYSGMGYSGTWNNSATYNNVGFYFYIAVLAALFLIARKEKRAYFVLFWFIVGLLIMEFDPYHVTLSPFSYLLQHRLDRYLTFIAPPAVLMIAIAAVRIVDKARSNRSFYLRMLLATSIILFLITTAIPIDMLWHSVQAYEASSQVQIARYLDGLANTTRIYFNSGQAIPIYMGFKNYSRFIIYDQIDNCTQLMPNSYIALNVYTRVYDTDYTPAAVNPCTGWVPIALPQEQNVSQQVFTPGSFAQAELYYIP